MNTSRTDNLPVLRWSQVGSGVDQQIVAYGVLSHRITRSVTTRVFFATSGVDWGKGFLTQEEAIQWCRENERKAGG